MKKILFSIIVLTAIICFCACGDVDNTEETIEETTTETAVVYSDNETINQFMTEYNSITESQFTDINDSSRDYNCYASSYGYWFEMRDLDDGSFEVLIDQTDEVFDEGMPGMKDAFHDTVKTLDPSLSDDEINGFYDELLQAEHMVEDEKIGNITVQYWPNTELSNGISRGHVDIIMEAK